MKHKQIRQQGLNYYKGKQMSKNTLHVRKRDYICSKSVIFLKVDTLLFDFVLIIHYSYICYQAFNIQFHVKALLLKNLYCNQLSSPSYISKKKNPIPYPHWFVTRKLFCILIPKRGWTSNYLFKTHQTINLKILRVPTTAAMN